MLRASPDPDARFTLQHCQMAHDAHFRRMARLGICVNLFANHLYYWGDQHYALTMGPERAERMDAAGSAQRLGVAYSIHSDAPVTHLAPLFTAWCAVNRRTTTGRVLGTEERVSVADALHAVTIGAAFTLKLDTEIGSIECGKRADFAILEDDPLAVDPAKLHEVPVWARSSGGASFRIPRSAPAEGRPRGPRWGAGRRGAGRREAGRVQSPDGSGRGRERAPGVRAPAPRPGAPRRGARPRREDRRGR